MISEPRSGSTPEEMFRATLLGLTPEGEPSTLIVTRQGMDREARVWITFSGAIKATVALTDSEAAELSDLVGAATKTWS